MWGETACSEVEKSSSPHSSKAPLAPPMSTRQKARHSELLTGLKFRLARPGLRGSYEVLPVVAPAPPLLPPADPLLPMFELLPCMLPLLISLWLPPAEPP